MESGNLESSNYKARGIRNPSSNVTITIGNLSSNAKECQIQSPKSGNHGMEIKPV